MTKADLIESLATKLDLQKTLAERIVNTMFDDIEGALQKGDKVNISGFGTFAVSARKAFTVEELGTPTCTKQQSAKRSRTA